MDPLSKTNFKTGKLSCTLSLKEYKWVTIPSIIIIKVYCLSTSFKLWINIYNVQISLLNLLRHSAQQ